MAAHRRRIFFSWSNTQQRAFFSFFLPKSTCIRPFALEESPRQLKADRHGNGEGGFAEHSPAYCVDAEHRKSATASRHGAVPHLCRCEMKRQGAQWLVHPALCATSVSMSVTNLTQWQRLVLETEMIQFWFFARRTSNTHAGDIRPSAQSWRVGAATTGSRGA